MAQFLSLMQSVLWHWLEQTLVLVPNPTTERVEDWATILPRGQMCLHQERLPRRRLVTAAPVRMVVSSTPVACAAVNMCAACSHSRIRAKPTMPIQTPCLANG